MYAALEYSVGPKDMADDEELLEDMSLDMSLFPVADKEEMAMIEKSLPERPTPDKLKVVEDDIVTSADGIEQDEDSETEGKTGSEENAVEDDIEDTQNEMQDDNIIDYRIVEQLPQFPGGMGAFIKWLSTNLKYPPAAKKQGIQGRVTVSFIINKDGTVSDAKVAASYHPLLDSEAMRVIGLMPKWTPGTENGKPCRTLFAIPIIFKI